MASESQVRQYLAYWFQLGKSVFIHNGQETLKPTSVIAGNRYSDEFEAAWKLIRSPEAGDCYLEGTEQTIAQLLSEAWEISPCARCSMPVPMRSVGLPSLSCPCTDLPGWPDNQTIQPRSPVNSTDRLLKIRDRLQEAGNS
jgi:hypothetical protein